MKYIELFKNGFDSTIDEKTKPENYPYVGYSPNEGLKLSMIKTEDGYTGVDLGLPNGTIWADRNIGAETPQDNGLYFQWGDTVGYTAEQVEAGEKVFNWDTYFDVDKESGYNKYGNPNAFKEYNTESGSTTLTPEDDAANINMGSDWRMPTIEEYQELVNAVKSSDGTKGTLTCQYEYIDLNGEQQSLVVYKDSNNGFISVLELFVDGTAIYKTILGIRFTNDTTGASVYFPACGYTKDSILGGIGDNGWYWCSPISSNIDARQFILNPNGIYALYGERRYYGMCVRGVHA